MQETLHAEEAPRAYASVFLISLASLALEVLQMRIFAFSLWHHLAFLVVSIAILGFGAGGAFLSVLGVFQRRSLGRSIWVASGLFAVTAFIGPYLLAQNPIDVFNQVGPKEVGRVALYYLVFALPYFFAGWVISLAFTKAPEHASRTYFFNLVGSGIGCFAIYPILTPLGAAGTLVAIAMLAVVAAIAAPVGWFLRPLAGAALLGLALLLPGVNEKVRPTVDGWLAKLELPRLDDLDPKKHPHQLLRADEIFAFKPAGTKFINTYTDHHEQKVLATRWSPLGRIDIVNDPTVGANGEAGACLFQDGDAPGQMPHRDWPIPAAQIHGIGYVVKDKPKALLIGIGGGLDIHVARARGAKEIDAVEINAETLDLYKGQFAELTGKPAELPNVRLHVAEGRHFIRSSNEKFDLIQMSGVDTYTALANGAYVLSESYLYTREAIHDYLDHLSDDGLLTVIRFAFPAPRETLRLLVIANEVLVERNVAEPWKHMALLWNPASKEDPESTRLGAFLLSKSPFSDEQLQKLGAWADATGFEVKLMPGRAPAVPFDSFLDAIKDKSGDRLEEFLATYPYKVGPVSDDRPFFFNQHGWGAVWKRLRDGKKQQEFGKNAPWAALSKKFQNEPIGLILLALTLAQLAVLVLIFVFGPLLFIRKNLEVPGWKAPLGYFVCLGFAYILLMISAMQRFGLILGHPTYSVTVTMATFMIGSGLGSLFSGRLDIRRAPILLWIVAILLAAGAALLEKVLPELAGYLLTQSFAVRAGVCAVVLLPFAFLMGMCFPTGVRMLDRGRKALIPWAYGVNGAASVLGSVLAVVLAMNLGFTKVQWVSAGLYVFAAVLMVFMARDAKRAEMA